MKYLSADSSAWPLMMSGVRASSMRMLSTSSTIAEGALTLHPLLELHDHVVAQIVEPELVVRAVGDVGRVGLAPLDGSQVEQPLVVRGIAGLEEYEASWVIIPRLMPRKWKTGPSTAGRVGQGSR